MNKTDLDYSVAVAPYWNVNYESGTAKISVDDVAVAPYWNVN